MDVQSGCRGGVAPEYAGASMPSTVRLPKELHRAEFRAPSCELGAAIRAGDPVASFSRDGKVSVLRSTASGTLLALLVSEPIECVAGDPIALVGDANEDIGYSPARIECVRVELLNKCSRCGNDYPVNGLVEQVLCAKCGDTDILGEAFWREYLIEDVGFARVPGARGGGEVLGGPSIECRGLPPFCRSCSALIPLGALTEAWGAAKSEGGASIPCASCGELHAGRMPPEWGRSVFEGLVFLFGELATDGAGKAPKPVIFKCPNCTAALSIAGKKRVVTCQFCESDVFLPDELWLHLNPAAKKAQWWMLFEPKKRRR